MGQNLYDEDLYGTSFLDKGIFFGNPEGKTILLTLDDVYLAEVMDKGEPTKVNLSLKQDSKLKTKKLIFEERPLKIADANITSEFYFKTNGVSTNSKLTLYDVEYDRIIYCSYNDRLEPSGVLVLKEPVKSIGGRKYRLTLELDEEVEFIGAYRGDVFIPFFQAKGVGLEFKKAVSFPIWKEREYEVGELRYDRNKILMCIEKGFQHGDAKSNRNKWISIDKLLLKLFKGDSD